jgi:hypothetical protein
MAKAKSKPTSPFTGRWRIVSMSAWDDDFIDEEEEGYFEFTDNNQGNFRFGSVRGEMDCYLTEQNDEPKVEWSWDGNDEMEEAQGRGWALLKGEELHGMLFFHGGDNTEFIAKRMKAKPTKKKR